MNFKTGTALLLFLIICLIISCEFNDPISEYLDVDFLAASDLTNWNIADDAAAYINFAAVTTPEEAGDVSSLPVNSEVYRLELVNLLPNGDFENGDITGWNMSTPTIAERVNNDVIEGYSLSYLINPSTEYIEYDLSTLVSAGNQYKILFDFVVSADVGTSGKANFFMVKDGINRELIQYANISVEDKPDGTLFSNQALEFAYETGDERFVIGGVEEKGFIDNIRLSCTSIEQNIVLEVPYRQSADDELPLISGTYTFSVWVKSEASDYVTPNVTNRFPARSLTLHIEGINGCSGSEYAYFNSMETVSVWTEYQVNGEIGVLPQTAPTVVGDPYPSVIRLSITPRNNSADSSTSWGLGSILIAAPSLVFSDDQN